MLSLSHPAISLRPYQQECIERVIDLYTRCPLGGKALIVLPTGGGKTIVFAEIVRRLRLTTLIIAHRQELLQQAADKLRIVDPTAIIGQVGAGKHEWGAPITVASVQTISRPEHLKNIKQFGYKLVIIDECHHTAASGYQSIINELRDAFVLGVTATPDRLDKLNIESIFGPPVFSASIIDMIEQGYLSNLRAIAIPTTTSLDGLHTQDGDFKLDELEVAVDTPDRNERIAQAYLKHCIGRQALCFAVTVDHAHHLAEAFQEAGVRAAVVSGGTPPEERKRLLQEYERSEIQVLCNCGVLTEGYDAPQTSCILMARPTKSRALYVQCVGRGTRLAPQKTDCIILDITDNCLKHRLEPVTLSKALGQVINDGESVLEAKRRKEQEEMEEEKQERTTTVTKRTRDLEINLLARMDWKRQGDGTYILEIGERKHQVFLIPSRKKEGYYSVKAQLAHEETRQEWLGEAPLEWAQMHAEMKARLMQDEKLALVDQKAPWRSRPISEKQRFMLIKYNIPFREGLTAGEASDLIGAAIEQKDQRQATKRTKRGRNR